MIILKLNEDVTEKRKKLKRKRKVNEDLFNYTRMGLIINNKPHFVISVEEKNLVDEDFKRILSRYKGEIIASEKLSENEFINELLFDEKPFMKKAIFQNFIKLFNNEKSKQLNVFVCDFSFDLKDELPLLLPKIKTLTVKVSDDFCVRDWQRKCFFEYGVKPNIVTDSNTDFIKYDVVANFDSINNKMLRIEFQNEKKEIYPERKFLELTKELKLLSEFGLSESTICAAFKKY
ncbi:MAG: hypothetical protein E7522_01590 [Ruminococcaceae bacterium]|nr:hypothetical protein [Oscillospiraceae bacterium]